MDPKDIIGICILVAAVVLTVILLQFRFIRRRPLLLLAFLVNPGVVGILGGCAFLLRDTTAANPCWISSMVLMIPSTFVVMFVVPKAVFAELATKDGAPPDDQGKGQP